MHPAAGRWPYLNLFLALSGGRCVGNHCLGPFQRCGRPKSCDCIHLDVYPCLFCTSPLLPSFASVLYKTNVVKITLFPLGGFLIVVKDFEGPDVPSEELRERMYLRWRRTFTNSALLLRRLSGSCLSQHPNARENGDIEKGGEVEKKNTVSSSITAGQDEGLDQNTTAGTTIIPTPAISLNDNGSDYLMPSGTSSTLGLPQQPTDHHSHRHQHNLLSRSRHFLKQLLKPCTIVIILSFVISLVDPLKALFIPPSSNFQPHFRPTAPDGQPPLAFIFDTATFVGGACIPLGLICLGSALTSLNLRSGGPFPIGAIASLALGKMLVIPIIGVAITRGFAHVGFMNRDDKVLQFVCMCVISSFCYHWHSLYSLAHPSAYYRAFRLPRLR